MSSSLMYLTKEQNQITSTIAEAIDRFHERTFRRPDVVYVGLSEWTTLDGGTGEFHSIEVAGVRVECFTNVFSMIGPALQKRSISIGA